MARRVDLRQRPLVTVDPQSARDYDDAVHAAHKEGGGWTLTVAVADVAHYVTMGSHLETDARERSFSAYFPDRVIPMLPDRLSGDLCSLRPDVDRFAMVVELDVSPKGEMDDIRVMGGRHFPSHMRLNYDRAAFLLGVHPDGITRDPIIRIGRIGDLRP